MLSGTSFYLQFGFGQDWRGLFDRWGRLRDFCRLYTESLQERIRPGLVGSYCATLRRHFTSFVIFRKVEVYSEPNSWAGPGLVMVYQNPFEFGFRGLFHRSRLSIGWGWLLLNHSQIGDGVGWVKRSIISEVFISWNNNNRTSAIILLNETEMDFNPELGHVSKQMIIRMGKSLSKTENIIWGIKEWRGYRKKAELEI